MEKERRRARQACSLVCQWTPVGKPLANVNNAQEPSTRKLDANDAQFHCVYLTASC